MWKCLVLVTGLLTANLTHAADAGLSSTDALNPTESVEAPLTAAPENRGPIEAATDKYEEEKSEEQLRQEARLAELEAANAAKIARVVVLKWQDSKTDHHNENLQRNIKTRIARPDAKFYPDIDLYQAGRVERDETIRPIDQRAVVPPSAADMAMTAVDEVATIPWNALSEQDWGLEAYKLRELAKEIWFIDRPELREPMFMLYAQIGRAAENANTGSPPFYEQIGDRTVNYYWYLAGSMAHEDPTLLSKLTEQDMNASISFYKDSLDQGGFPPMTLSFAPPSGEGAWDAKKFASEFELFINGLPIVVTDPNGLQRAAPGRVDVYMRRADGHSLSDRLELDKLDKKFYYVLQVARTRMGLDFIDQLMEHPNECSPELDGDILNYLAIYAKLHPGSEVYITVPVGGSTASNKILLWRWDRPSGTLQKVLDDTGGFPVRFVALVGAGITFSTATYEPLTAEQIAEDASAANPADPDAGIQRVLADAEDSTIPLLAPEGVPFHFHLRGHYGRLMMGVGIEFAAHVASSQRKDGLSREEDGGWADLYQTNSIIGPNHELKKEVEAEYAVRDDEGNPTGETDTAIFRVDVLRERDWQRLVLYQLGFVLGKNAAIGFGPRFFAQTGWFNIPHAVDISGHGGWAFALSPKANGRVRPIFDADLFGGIMVPFRDSVFIVGDKKLGKVLPDFGMKVSVGLTF